MRNNATWQERFIIKDESIINDITQQISHQIERKMFMYETEELKYLLIVFKAKNKYSNFKKYLKHKKSIYKMYSGYIIRNITQIKALQ